MNKEVFIASSSKDNLDKKYYDEAKEVAKVCISKGYDLSFGGYNHGIMKVIYDEYKKSNLNIKAISLSKYKEELCTNNYILTNSLDEQIKLFSKSNALIYLPGGTGTFLELMYLLNLKVIGEINSKIIIVNTLGFYDKIIEHFKKLYEEKFLDNDNLFIEIKNINELEKVL